MAGGVASFTKICHCEVSVDSRNGVYITNRTPLDPSTGIYVSDSPCIAEYLETQYMEGPKIFPHNTIGLQIDFKDAFNKHVSAMWDFVMLPIFHILNAKSQTHYWKSVKK